MLIYFSFNFNRKLGIEAEHLKTQVVWLTRHLDTGYKFATPGQLKIDGICVVFMVEMVPGSCYPGLALN